MHAVIHFRDDTLRAMARWAAKHYDLGRVDIIFTDGGYRGAGYQGGSGATYFDGDHAVIELNERRTYAKLAEEVLPHELAHTIAMKRYGYRGHGRKFVKIANELIGRWNSYAKQEGGAA